MIDLKTGKFILGEGLEVYPGMKLEDFKKTELYKSYTIDRKKTDKNEWIYPLTIGKIDGFELNINIFFDDDGYLEDIEISKKGWYVHEIETEEKIGRSNNYEYEYSVLDYLNKFLMSQIEGSVEGGRELWFDYKWGTIKTTFLPYGATASPANIKLTIQYRTRLFKPEKESNLTLEQMFGWE
ncbi:MAG: hypothetical protein GX287_01540 [Fusobacteria bacterium]|nr:hypothetical protein [Fusobacteriota bacterium]